MCASCSDELRSLKEAADFIESHRSDLEPRPESWNLVRARMASADSRFFPPLQLLAPSRWRIAAAALALIAALALGYQQYQQFQRRSLDQYISQYIREREAHRQPQSILGGPETNPQIQIPYADNPFIEVKATLADNPFRSED
jgi:hypothetical protein